MNLRNVWPAVVTALGGMAVIGAMAVLKVDKDIIMWTATALLVPLLTALVVGQNAETKATLQQSQQETRAAVQQVQQQTNGNTSRLMDIVEAQGRLLAQLSPQPAPAPPDPPAAPPGSP